MKLNDDTVRAMRPPAARREIADDSVRGLYLMVQPNGSKSWAIRYRFGGGQRKYTLGKFPAVRLGETRSEKKLRLTRDPDSASPCARDLARAAFDRIALGEDPHAERMADRRGITGSADLVRNVWTDFAERHLSRKRAATAEAANRVYAKHLHKWKERRVGEITKRDVLDVLDSIAKAGHPTAAIRARAVMSKFFNWCRGRDIIKVSPCEGIGRPTSDSTPLNDRVLSDAELASLWRACDATPYPFGPMVKLLILTGQRREEIAGMRESEVRVAERLFVLPPERAKNHTKNEVYLSDAALKIIGSLPKIANPNKSDKAGRFLFTKTGSTSSTGYSRAKISIDKLMAKDFGGPVAPWRLHDLRRTAISGMARLGIALPVIEKCVNHVSGSFAGIVGVYQKHSYADEKAAAFAAWSRHVENIVKRN